jgi:hypothetical protein
MTWVDMSVVPGTTYTYRIRMVTQDSADEKWYESTNGLEAVMKAEDTINPLPPEHISITHTTLESGKDALKIAWTQPADATQVKIYRSTIYGNQGSLLGSVQTTATGEYIDSDVSPNVQYWYTLVSVDAADNASSGHFALPAPGNDYPFNYQLVTGE